ncbi:MAG: energy-coupling factor transport system ATP-binding protein [Pseudonocardiales bacterium]|nr:energy-coupling factor transport system ATP-binding protein [Pseudonocardiales bacterium]
MSLQMRGASYAYAGTSKLILEGIDLAVEPGRLVAIVGPNESGKSTLCLVAAGLAPASIGGRLTGSVTLDRQETASLRPYEAAQRCGILFQNPATQLSGTSATVWEELAFGPRNLGLPIAEVVERVETAMATLKIGGLADRDPHRLSGGQAQLVALASVVALRPSMLVLDEPTSQLDPAGTRLVGEAIVRFAAETGTAVLLVEHKTGLIARIADEVAVLVAGRIIQRGPTAEVLADPALEEHGVDPPPAVRLERAAAASGHSDRLAGLDLTAIEMAPIDGLAPSGTAPP